MSDEIIDFKKCTIYLHLIMKTIFIATDFSEASLDAVQYGLELAHLMGLKSVLFHAYHTAVTVPDAYAPVTAEELRQTAEKEMKRLGDQFRKTNNQSIDVLAVEGDLPDVLLSYTTRYPEVLLVCGMKGSGKRKWGLLGSSIMSVIRKSHSPVLAIPQGFKMTSISKMAFATDFNFETDIQTLRVFQEMGEHFKSKAIIVRITTGKYKTMEEIHYRSERLNVYLKKMDPEYVFLADKDVTDGLMRFADESNIDLMALIARPHNFMERLLGFSETRSMLYKTVRPLLILPEIKVETKTGLVKKAVSQQ
jgi:nucleotide-binding universal stress UspA family protein